MDIKITPSKEEQRKIDTIQPYILKDGRMQKNEKFEQFYGKFSPNVTPGEGQKGQWLDSIGAKEKSKKRDYYYIKK